MLGFKLGTQVNPADAFIKVVAINYPKTKEDDKKLKLLLDGYHKFQVPLIAKDNLKMLLVEFIPKTNNFSVAPFWL